MENLNLALLTSSIPVKSGSNSSLVRSRHSSEKEFSGVMAREESRCDDAYESDEASPKELENNSSDRSKSIDQKTAGDSKPQPLNSGSSDEASEDTDNVTSVGANVYSEVPSEDSVEEKSAKNGNLAVLVDVIDNQVLSAEVSEPVVMSPTPTPTLAAEPVSTSPKLSVAALKPTLTGQDGKIIDEKSMSESQSALSPKGNYKEESLTLSAIVDQADDSSEEGENVSLLEENLARGKEATLTHKESSVDSAAQSIEKIREEAARAALIAEKSAAGKIDAVEIAKAIAETPPADLSQSANSNLPTDLNPAPAAAAEVITPAAGKNETTTHRQGRKLEAQSGKGISIDKLSGDNLEIKVDGEEVVSDEKLQQKADLSDYLSQNQNRSGSDSGTVHLQGRARENQALLTENGQGQKDALKFSDEMDRRGPKISVEDSKSVTPESASATTLLAAGAKEKASIETASAKPLTLTIGHSEADSNAAALKKGAAAKMSKPLPITDDHLLNQIQAGLNKPVNGRQTVTIKLWPEHLGRVDIKLVMNKQHLTATFMVDHAEVKDSMMRKIDSLRDSLGLRGIDAKDISIKVNPAKSGDGGPSLMSDNQQQNGSNSAWRQFGQGSYGGNSFGQGSGWRGNPDEDNAQGGTGIANPLNEVNGIPTIAENFADSGSLHLTA